MLEPIIIYVDYIKQPFGRPEIWYLNPMKTSHNEIKYMYIQYNFKRAKVVKIP